MRPHTNQTDPMDMAGGYSHLQSKSRAELGRAACATDAVAQQQKAAIMACRYGGVYRFKYDGEPLKLSSFFSIYIGSS